MIQSLSDEALRKMVSDHVGCEIEKIGVYHRSEPPIAYFLSHSPDWDDLTVFIAPYMDGWDGTMLRSTRVVIINKYTGYIVSEGNAEDDGYGSS